MNKLNICMYESLPESEQEIRNEGHKHRKTIATKQTPLLR